MARTVVVTGGNRGIGLATAQAFSRQGDRVAVAHRGREFPDGMFGSGVTSATRPASTRLSTRSKPSWDRSRCWWPTPASSTTGCFRS